MSLREKFEKETPWGMTEFKSREYYIDYSEWLEKREEYLIKQLQKKDKVIEAVEDWRANLRCSYHNSQCMKLANNIDEYTQEKKI